MPRPGRPATPTLQTGHALYSALVALHYSDGSGNLIDAKGGASLTPQGTADVVVDGTYGSVGRMDANDESFRASASAGQRVTEGSIVWYGIPLATASAYAPIYGITWNQAGDNPYVAMSLYRESSGDNVVFAHNNGIATFNFTPTGGYDWHLLYGTDVCLIANNGNGDQELWVNGTSRGTSSQAGTMEYGIDHSTTNSYIGTGPMATGELSRNAQIKTILGMEFNRVLTDPEVTLINDDPWLLMRPTGTAIPVLMHHRRQQGMS